VVGDTEAAPILLLITQTLPELIQAEVIVVLSMCLHVAGPQRGVQASQEDLHHTLLAALGGEVEVTDSGASLEKVGGPPRLEVEESGEVGGLVAVPRAHHGPSEREETLIHGHSGGVARDGDVGVDGETDPCLPRGQCGRVDDEGVRQLQAQDTLHECRELSQDRLGDVGVEGAWLTSLATYFGVVASFVLHELTCGRDVER
jgi:hypothetical protein